jgi:uncharacterized protein (DUF58 family)
MWRRRLGYLALVLAALALYLFENNAGTRMLLVVLAALPVLSALALVAVRPALTAALTLPAAPSRGETCAGQLTLHNAARLTLPCVRCTVRLRNLVTGETSSLTLAASVGARRDAVLEFTFCAAHYGALTAQVESLALCDCLGLFARKIPCTAQAETSIAPTRHRVSVQLADTPDFLLDSERYSADRPGGDPSETFRIRDYAPGDPIRQIHWKLTEKTGKTLVRDFGLPVVRDLLLLLETSALPGAALTPDDHDLQLELLLSLSQALAAQEIAHTVGWQDGASGAYTALDIASAGDLPALESHLLHNPIRQGDATVVGSFCAQALQCAYAHAAVLSPYPTPDLAALCHGNRVTLLLPQAASEEAGIFCPVWSADDLRSDYLSLEL